MSKVLVTYATKTGCTAGVAEQIGRALGELGVEIDLVPVDEGPDASAYSAVIVGSGVRAGSWHGAAKSWVKENAGALRARPVAFFTVGLTLASGPEKLEEVRAYTDPLIEESGIAPLDVGLFKGWNVAESFSLPERLVLKALKAPKGDFREPDAIAAWARSVAGGLGVAQ